MPESKGEKMPDAPSPPFPPLTWDGYFWTAGIVLTAWAGFQSRHGPYASADSATASDGSVSLNVATPENEPTPPSLEQAAAYEHLTANQEVLRDTILQAVFAEYPKWQQLYGDDVEDAVEVMPDIEGSEQLKALVGLSTVHILPAIAPSDAAGIGFEFGRTRDNVPGPLSVTESGAHLCGFPSHDSDVDLRGCFAAPLANIVSLNQPEGTREPSGLVGGVVEANLDALNARSGFDLGPLMAMKTREQAGVAGDDAPHRRQALKLFERLDAAHGRATLPRDVPDRAATNNFLITFSAPDGRVTDHERYG